MSAENEHAINNNQGWDLLLRENPLTSQLIGLSPILAISDSLALSLLMGFIFALTLCISSMLVSLTRLLIPPPAALACYVLFTATIVTIIDLLMQAYLPEARQQLGIYLPIIAANCLILDRTLVFAAQNPLFSCLKDSLRYSLAVILVLFLLGTFRELAAYGSLMKDLNFIFGDSVQDFSIQLSANNKGFVLASLPAGAFISFGFLIALINFLSSKSSNNANDSQ